MFERGSVEAPRPPGIGRNERNIARKIAVAPGLRDLRLKYVPGIDSIFWQEDELRVPGDQRVNFRHPG